MSSNGRLVHNTIFLYIRMLVSIIVNFYSIKLLWKVLGIDNYGIMGVVGAMAMMFAFLNSAMVASSQRFISYELGRGDPERLHKTFSGSLAVHAMLSVVIFILAETVGLWLLNTRLNIPEGRMFAANCVYQSSLISFLLNVMSVPYNACIVAHEHMKVFGYFGILEVIAKLGIIFLTAAVAYDRLITYAVLLLCVSTAMRALYAAYCKKNFTECKYTRERDDGLIRQMFGFAGWSFLGNLGFAVRDQGNNLLINIFFNVAVNAAMSVANQISGTLKGFAANFIMAVNPQITKCYAAGDLDRMRTLLFAGCKYSFLLMTVVVVPVYVAAGSILSIWLGDVAPFTVGFLRWVLLMSLIDCVVGPITTSLQATGCIRRFQIVICVIMGATFPIAWLALKWWHNPYVVMIVGMIASIVALVARLILLHDLVEFSYKGFLMKVYSRTLPCLVLAMAFAVSVYQMFPDNVIGLLGFCFIVVLVNLLLAVTIALDGREKTYIAHIIRKKLCKKSKMP